jgi:hypothetical protein
MFTYRECKFLAVCFRLGCELLTLYSWLGCEHAFTKEKDKDLEPSRRESSRRGELAFEWLLKYCHSRYLGIIPYPSN